MNRTIACFLAACLAAAPAAAAPYAASTSYNFDNRVTSTRYDADGRVTGTIAPTAAGRFPSRRSATATTAPGG
ncbi:MAG: hypothetical protein WBR13_00195 [Allosphingosinicella sp.]